jgi:nitroimidazol reductase NimA-like FMN-containing flavoprotein (pyridoxamine 5'-phosphate oxidase superfamily)
MPRSYGLRPEADGLLAWDWVEERLATARNYWISSTRPDGRPHAMPVWGVWVQGAVVFGTHRASRKARNLAANASIAVHLESGDEAVILEGRAVEATDRSLLSAYVEAYERKYSVRPDPSDKENVTLMVRPRRALAWREPDFVSSATRWEFGE